MKYIFTLSIMLTITILAGCESGPNRGKGFSLPEGNILTGKATFVELGCNTCHSIADIEQLPSENKDLPRIKLGGSVGSARLIKTYGELVTSIINPSHKVVKRYNQGVIRTEDGGSTMRVYNDIMTVTQLVNLVTFLEDNYKIPPYQRTKYPAFPIY